VDLLPSSDQNQEGPLKVVGLSLQLQTLASLTTPLIHRFFPQRKP